MTGGVRLDLFHVRHVVDGLRWAASVRSLRATPGCLFAKVLGTGSARTFAPPDADLHRWAALTVWDDDPAALEKTAAYERVHDRSTEHACLGLVPVRSRGSWSRQNPFTVVEPPSPSGPVAALTRARIRPSQWRRFWSSVPPVAAEAALAEGMLLALAIGEAPVGWQGTFSVWADEQSLQDFAYHRPAHRTVLRATDETGWYAEQLFARFVVASATGTWQGLALPSLLQGH